MFVSYLFPSFSWLLLPSANFEINIYQVQLDGRVGLRSYEEKLQFKFSLKWFVLRSLLSLSVKFTQKVIITKDWALV